MLNWGSFKHLLTSCFTVTDFTCFVLAWSTEVTWTLWWLFITGWQLSRFSTLSFLIMDLNTELPPRLFENPWWDCNIDDGMKLCEPQEIRNEASKDGSLCGFFIYSNAFRSYSQLILFYGFHSNILFNKI